MWIYIDIDKVNISKCYLGRTYSLKYRIKGVYTRIYDENTQCVLNVGREAMKQSKIRARG